MEIRGNLPDNSAAICVATAGDRISEVAVLGPATGDLPYLSPGFIDLQLNGLAGVDFSHPELTTDQICSVLPRIWRSGVTTFCPTLITMSQGALIRNLATLEQARMMYPAVARTAPCYHLEGPYFVPSQASGVHLTSWMRPPSWGEFQELQDAAGGNIGLVTLGPEVPGAVDFTRRLVESGIVVAISHTEANAALIHAVTEAGARLSTHLGNGCPQLLDRHKAPFWAQLADDRLAASLICDSFHLCQEMVQIIHRIKGLESCILVSDSSHIAGLPPGRYQFLSVEVELLPDGKVIRADGGSLAAASVSLDRGVRVFSEQAGLPLQEALKTVTVNPARLIPRLGLSGELRPGEPANLITFWAEPRALRVETVLVGGKVIDPAVATASNARLTGGAIRSLA